MARPTTDPEEQENLVYDLVEKTAAHIGLMPKFPRDKVVCFGDYVGPGYSLPTPEMAEAVRMLARTEGILLDPVYTGKAMAGLIDLCQQGIIAKGSRQLFIHTGGAQALPAYLSVLR